MPRWSVLEDWDEWRALEPGWRDLIEDSAGATPFQTPEWMLSWWEVFGSSRLHVFVAKHGRELVGIWPLQVRSGPWRVLCPVGIRGSDYLNPLIRRGAERLFCELFDDHLDSLRGVDLVDLQQVREDTRFELTGSEPQVQAACWVLDLPHDYEGYLRSLSKGLRYDCRHPIEGAVIEKADPDNVARSMEALFDLHAARWRARGLPGVFFLPGVKRFQQLAAARLARSGKLNLYTMSLNGDCIGALHAMRCDSTTFFYQSGFSSALKRSPGTLLIAHAIREAVEAGDKHFDFMRGDELYKRRWKPHRLLHNRRYILALNSHRGWLGRLGCDAGRRMESRIRATLER